MKTNEEKLKKLLEVAVENGWSFKSGVFIEFSKNKLTEFEIIERTKDYNYSDKGVWIYYIPEGSTYGEKYSLNDLVTNFEPNEVSFIEALIKNGKPKGDEMCGVGYYRQKWANKPTSQRLEWLFETFSHLF